MQRWEYMCVAGVGYEKNFPDSAYRLYDVYSGEKHTKIEGHGPAYCNKLGEQGWELVGVACRGYDQNYISLFFKRPKQ